MWCDGLVLDEQETVEPLAWNDRPESALEYCVMDRFLKLVSQKDSCGTVDIYVVTNVDERKHCESNKMQFYSTLHQSAYTEIEITIMCKM